MIIKLSLNVQTIWVIFITILKNKISIKIEKIDFFDDGIAYMLSNKKVNSLVTDLFIRGAKLNIYLVLLRNLILLHQNILN